MADRPPRLIIRVVPLIGQRRKCNEPATAAHALFRRPFGRHDRAAYKDGCLVRRRRLRATDRRPQSDSPVRAFRGQDLVRQADRARALHRELDFGGARHAATGAGRRLHLADLEFPGAGQDRRYRSGQRDGSRIDAGKIARAALLPLRGRRRGGVGRRGAGQGSERKGQGQAAGAAIERCANSR
jgi:hypothetical protein